jgi:hypothetical protein
MSRELFNELHHAAARQAACEAVVVQVVVPLLKAIDPELARELIDGIRAGFTVSTPTQDEFLRLATEEYLQRLADSIEARVRSKIGARR